MFCSNCGSPINPGEMFCGNCGTKVEVLQSIPYTNETYVQQNVKYKKEYNFGNMLLLFACVLVMVSVFLPYAQVEVSSYSESVNLIFPDGNLGDGVIVLGIALIVFILDLLKLNMGNIIGSAAMVLFSMYEISSIYSSGVTEYVTYGIGCAIFMIGAVVMLLVSIIGFLISSSSKKKFINNGKGVIR
jgi:hypothetical protein